MRFCLMLVAALALAMLGRPARAADPQPYSVHFDPTGNGALDATLRDSAQLQSLRTSAPAGPFALLGRAQQDIGRLQTVMESFGYYRSHIQVTIEDKALDDPELPDQLQAMPKDRTAKVNVHIDMGPLFHLRRVTLEGEVSAKALTAFALKSGAPAVAADVLAARQRLEDALGEEGHALATVDDPVAYEDAQEPVLDVSFKVTAGPVSHIGEIRFVGLKRMHEAFVRRLLLLHSGDLYQPSKIEAARTDLLSLGVFSGITVRPPTAVDADGNVTIIFDLQERPLYAVTLTAAYSSDLGASAGATWSDRNLFGNAEQLNVTTNVNGWGGTVETNFGYNGVAQYIKPDFLQRDQSLQFSVGALKQSLITYDQTAFTAGSSISRKLSSLWKASAGVALEDEEICQVDVNRNYTLVSLPLNLNYDSTDRSSILLDPTHGLIGLISVAPTESLPTSGASSCNANGGTSGYYQNPHSASYVAIQANWSAYLDLARFGWTQPGHTVFALRALEAQVIGASDQTLPPDQRFYAGGSNTVRGYLYQTIGPLIQGSDGIPAGGVGLDAAGFEVRQRVWGNFGTAAFIDIGTVREAGERPFTTPFSVGYGLGVRYYTPIGAVRVDVAVPEHKLLPPNNSPIELYVGLGQAF